MNFSEQVPHQRGIAFSDIALERHCKYKVDGHLERGGPPGEGRKLLPIQGRQHVTNVTGASWKHVSGSG